MSQFLPLRIPKEPRWKAYHRNLNFELSPNVKDWLLDNGSLTRRLLDASDGNFRVQVLQQSLGKPKLSESRRLSLKQGEWALIREVVLMCFGEPWVFARSVIPRTTMVGSTQHLRGMGSRPLGAELFKDPSLRRKVVDIAKISAKDISLIKHHETAWARRSLFTVGGKGLLVAEIFLPEVLSSRAIRHPVKRQLIC
ncbi:MAG: chorismate lyase [Pseudomonadales bacterium]|nr:chorismate lyase [Pseudomonadales bacterium]